MGARQPASPAQGPAKDQPLAQRSGSKTPRPPARALLLPLVPITHYTLDDGGDDSNDNGQPHNRCRVCLHTLAHRRGRLTFTLLLHPPPSPLPSRCTIAPAVPLPPAVSTTSAARLFTAPSPAFTAAQKKPPLQPFTLAATIAPLFSPFCLSTANLSRSRFLRRHRCAQALCLKRETLHPTRVFSYAHYAPVPTEHLRFWETPRPLQIPQPQSFPRPTKLFCLLSLPPSARFVVSSRPVTTFATTLSLSLPPQSMS